MQELAQYQNNLPTTIEDLSKFVLVGREKICSVRAEIRAIDKLQLAEEVYEQKKEEVNLLARVVLDAEARLGELMKEIPKAKGGDQYHKSTIDSGVASAMQKPKSEIIKDLGFHPKQAERFEALADNKKAVEIAKFQASEKRKPVTREKALKAARFMKQLPEEQRQEIEDMPVEWAAAKLTQLYNEHLEVSVEDGSDISYHLREIYEVDFSDKALEGYLNGAVYDYKSELAKLDGLIRGLMSLKRKLVERMEMK